MGALEKIIKQMTSSEETVKTLIQPLEVFCLFDETRKIIKSVGMLQLLQKFAKADDEFLRANVQSILMSFDLQF